MSPYIFLLVAISLFIGLDFYAYSGGKKLLADIKSLRLRKTIRSLFWSMSALKIVSIIGLIVVYGFNYRQFQGLAAICIAALFLVLIPQIIFVAILIFEDTFRAGKGLYSLASNSPQKSRSLASEKKPNSRRKFISQMALGIASVPFLGILHGVTRGKYAFTVRKVQIALKDLPAAFHGFTLTQISDIHSGSFDNAEKVAKGVAMVNDQKSDMIVFTGDLVNNRADEIEPYIDTFKALEAPFGKFSILGNHDYGKYVQWASKEDEEANFDRLKLNHDKMGFKLMLNEHHILEKDGEKIALVGVENWGKPPFPQLGDLNKAVEGAEDIPVKILLSHDPSHWDLEVIEHTQKFHLTLSGHTHGMQFGIEIPGIKWSPVKYRYPRWAGLYEKAEQFLYVNRGFGFLAFPGRVGIWPEVTVIELLKA